MLALRMITVYGIPNCDTVRRARAWLTDHGREHRFHDLRKDGLPPQRLDAWLAAAGWERLVNRQGTTWRKLDEAVRAAAVDEAGVRVLLLAHPSAIRRPVVEWADGALSTGFDETDWQQRLPG